MIEAKARIPSGLCTCSARKLYVYSSKGDRDTRSADACLGKRRNAFLSFRTDGLRCHSQAVCRGTARMDELSIRFRSSPPVLVDNHALRQVAKNYNQQ